MRVAAATVIVVVPVVPVTAILRNTCLAERDQGFRLVPIADALHFGTIVIVMDAVASLGGSNYWAADVPAAIGDVVAF
jgi:hypothetical protein